MAMLYFSLDPSLRFSNHPTGRVRLQESVTYNDTDEGKYVVAFVDDNKTYFVTEILENGFPKGYLNGLDGRESLAETVMLFDNLEEIQSKLVKLRYKVIYQVEIDEDKNIYLKIVRAGVDIQGFGRLKDVPFWLENMEGSLRNPSVEGASKEEALQSAQHLFEEICDVFTALKSWEPLADLPQIAESVETTTSAAILAGIKAIKSAKGYEAVLKAVEELELEDSVRLSRTNYVSPSVYEDGARVR